MAGKNITKSFQHAWKLIRRYKRKIWLFERFDIYIGELYEPLPFFKSDISFKRGTVEDIPSVAEQYSSHFGVDSEKILSNRLSHGEILIIGYPKKEEKTICYISWLKKTDPFFKAIIQSKNFKNTIGVYRTLVAEKYRKMGIGKAGKIFSQKIALDLGYNKIISFVRKNNTASQRMNKRLGLKPQGQLIRLIIFKRQFLKVLW